MKALQSTFIPEGCSAGLLHLRALSRCLDAADAAGVSEEFLKIEFTSAAMKALSRLEENSAT